MLAHAVREIISGSRLMTLLLEDYRFAALQKVAKARFGELNEAERAVMRMSTSIDTRDPRADPGKRPDVHADFLRWLATDRDAVTYLDPGGIRVYNATISGDLDLRNCKLQHPLRLEYCTVRAGFYLLQASLPILYLDSCDLESGIEADEVRATGDIKLLSSVVKDKVSLIGAQIGGDLDLSHSTLQGTPISMIADRARISGSVQFGGADAPGATRYFSARGDLRFIGAQIEGDFDCWRAGPFGKLICEQMQVGKRMVYADIFHPHYAELDLAGASVGSFHDNKESWPMPGKLQLDGFVYQELVAQEPATAEQVAGRQYGDRMKLDVESRLCWLRRQSKDNVHSAQPWMQLARYLKAMGDDDGARHVVYAYKRQEARQSFWRPVSFVSDQIIEQPWEVLLFVLPFWTVGSLVFWRAARMKAMKETEPKGSDPLIPFNPAVYTLENVLPVVKMGQDSAWTPDPQANEFALLPDWGVVARFNRVFERWRLTRQLTQLDYTRLATMRWLLIIVGWVFAAILGYALDDLLKK